MRPRSVSTLIITTSIIAPTSNGTPDGNWLRCSKPRGRRVMLSFYPETAPSQTDRDYNTWTTDTRILAGREPRWAPLIPIINAAFDAMEEEP